MKNTIVANVEILINAPISKVWDALTNPETVKKYFFGTDMETNWKVGSPIFFKGVWEDKEYCDKGIVLEFVPEKLIRYNYFSSFSNLEDKPENYATVSYELAVVGGATKLIVTQDNIATEEARAHSEQNWKSLLGEMKKLIENN